MASRELVVALGAAASLGIVTLLRSRGNVEKKEKICGCAICKLVEVHREKHHNHAALQLCSTFIYGVNLTGHLPELKILVEDDLLKHLTFFGCEMGECSEICMAEATVMSTFKQPLAFEPYRKELYTIEELYAGYDCNVPDSYFKTKDHLIFRDFVESGTRENFDFYDSMARKMHDTCIAEAMNRLLLPGFHVCAIMGGHALARGSKQYRDAAKIARTLTRAGMLICSGGGPGAMEACNLGVWFSNRTDEELEDAIQILSRSPRFEDAGWLATACEIRRKYPLLQIAAEPVISLGIPTFFYGHEPPNMFQTHVAKFFANSIREDALLSMAYNGIIYFPGSAGTVQEIFQDGCQNHYEVFGFASPMVFMDEQFWTQKIPAYDLLKGMAKGKSYEKLIYVTDAADEAVEAILSFYHMKKPILRRLSSAPIRKLK